MQIKAEFEGRQWNISDSKTNYYNILASPNGKYLVANQGVRIKLFTTSGDEIADLGEGIPSSWHSNNKTIVGFFDVSNDGHEISNSDLYIYNIDSSNPIKITNTENEKECWPSFINENTIIYSDIEKEGLYKKIIET